MRMDPKSTAATTVEYHAMALIVIMKHLEDAEMYSCEAISAD